MRYLLPLFATLLLLVSCSMAEKNDRIPATSQEWSFIVFSDLHLNSKMKKDTYLPPKLKVLLEHLDSFVAAQKVDFIIISGDTTCGNKDDGIKLSRIKSWWGDLNDALTPIKNSGIPIFPIAGNHDYYTPAQREGYQYGACLLSGISNLCEKNSNGNWKNAFADFDISSNSNLYYRIDHKNFTVLNLHIPEYAIKQEQKDWIKDQKSLTKAVAIGHTALSPRLNAKPDSKRSVELQNIFSSIGIKHYIAGHEHLFWDDYLSTPNFRQTVVGTGSGTYTFPPSPKRIEQNCTSASATTLRCTMPTNGRSILFKKKDHTLVEAQSFLLVTVNANGSYAIEPFTYADGNFISLYQE